MKIDVFELNAHTDGMTDIYVDGEFIFGGDQYHCKIDEWFAGFKDGIQYITQIAPKVETHYFRHADKDDFPPIGKRTIEEYLKYLPTKGFI